MATSKPHVIHDYEPTQMLAAEPGWRACYWDDEAKKEGREPGVFSEPVVMWCLCRPLVSSSSPGQPWERDRLDRNRIKGFVAGDLGLMSPEESDNFAGYVPPGELPSQQPWWDEDYVARMCGGGD